MSSETSIDAGVPRDANHDQFQPWQLFVLAGLAGATTVVFLAVFVWKVDRETAILLSVIVGTAAIAGLAAFRTFAPFGRSDESSMPETVGGRTKAALEREKNLALRAIKDLEFDHAMGKLSEKDYIEMSARLRMRAAGLMRQLDQGTTSYREQIEKELAKRTGSAAAAAKRACAGCGTINAPDAKFCKECGGKLGE